MILYIKLYDLYNEKESGDSMQMDFKYGKHIDLIYHTLAHFHVDNASDLYLPAYIDWMKQIRNCDLTIPVQMENYYNDNFDRLSGINFLPFYSTDWDNLNQLLLNHHDFTEMDKKIFIVPFIQLLHNESAMYFEFWENQYQKIFDQKIHTENLLRNKFDIFQCLFDYSNKNAVAYLSFSLTRNGRGFSSVNGDFGAFAPFPQSAKDIKNVFFTLLHEYSHQITDPLLNTSIHMGDDSHAISENIVILFDYYLISTICEADIESYFNWLAHIAGIADKKISVDEFLHIFCVSDNVHNEIKNLIDRITRK